ncbi:MAG: tyrosine-type recombinase/integrase, partial [Anaerolineales bacterium]
METRQKDHRTILKFSQDSHILTWANAFLVDRKVGGLSEGTIGFYKTKLELFTDFCDSQIVTQITQITPNTIRLFLLHLEETGHNPGGRHAAYRTLRAFLNWWEIEVEPEGWKNPIKKVQPPKVSIKPLEPTDANIIRALLATCQRGTFYGERDHAIILALMDTGARANELLSMNLEDVNLVTGEILIRKGKGGKPRAVYLGKQSRKAMRVYLRKRIDDNNALWVSKSGERLNYNGLRSMMRRRAERAGVEMPSLHSFRRYFALSMLRAGVDIFSLQKLMG